MATNTPGNRLIDISDGFSDKKNLLQEKINSLYGAQQTVENPRKSYNPFLKNNGNLVNPYADYQPIVDSDLTSKRVKSWITQATGLTPTANNNTAATPDENNKNNNTQNSETTDDNSTEFNGNYDNSVLGSLDIKTELPRLTVNQISTIIGKHFGNSTVIKPSDAEGIYKAQQTTGMSALAMLAIGALESGWGTSSIAKQKNNLWGYGATNDNPAGNAHSYSQISEGATQFATEFMKTYYNGYGAKSINSAGTGDNPAGMGYAYYDSGAINPNWAKNVSSIMGTLYDTAKSVAPKTTTSSKTNSNSTSSGSTAGQKLVESAKKYLGTQYVYGGTSPDGFDCSGLMQYVAKENGINISRVAADQYKNGTAVDKNNLQPGDLVFFVGSQGSTTNPGHVGMYIGNGQYIQAPKTGDVVKISNLSARKDYVGARRIVN